MKMYEILIGLKQPGNVKRINVIVQADNQITAKQLVKAQYAGSGTTILKNPIEVKPFKIKK